MTHITTKQTLFARIKLIFVLFLSLGIISACNQENTSADTNKTTAKAPAIGTDIKDMVNISPREDTTGTVKKITWEHLMPDDFKPELIEKKYKKQIDSIKEGSEENSAETQALMDKIIAEFNNAPANKKLDGLTVKIPGFIALLDEKDGIVNEFLLVPYFGSCIHSPPPPINQTILVTTKKGKSISITDIYQPVWVTGKVKVERKETELAKAGYVIENAELEIYERENADDEGEGG